VSEFDAGDPVCWLPMVCDECGAMREQGPDAPCPRCGALPATAAAETADSERESTSTLARPS
jgi:hypothetical protein